MKNKKTVHIEPTIENLQQQRTYHVTQREFHDTEITFFERLIRLAKEKNTEDVRQEMKLLGTSSQQ